MAIPKREASTGFLHNERGVLHDYLFHATPGTSEKTGRSYERLSVELSIHRQGQPAPTRQFLHAGYLPTGVTVSPDGKTLLGTKVYAIDPATEWGKFVTTLFENPPGTEPKTRFPEDMYGAGTNYDSWMGAECLFDRPVDKEATEKRGQEVNQQTGKSYDRRQLVVLEVIALPAKGKAKGKSAAAPAATKAPALPVAVSETDTDALDAVLMATLSNLPNNVINRKGLGTAFLKLSSKLGQTGPARDVPRKMFAQDDYLLGAVERGVIDFDGSDDGAVTLLKLVALPY